MSSLYVRLCIFISIQNAWKFLKMCLKISMPLVFPTVQPQCFITSKLYHSFSQCEHGYAQHNMYYQKGDQTINHTKILFYKILHTIAASDIFFQSIISKVNININADLITFGMKSQLNWLSNTTAVIHLLWTMSPTLQVDSIRSMIQQEKWYISTSTHHIKTVSIVIYQFYNIRTLSTNIQCHMIRWYMTTYWKIIKSSPTFETTADLKDNSHLLKEMITPNALEEHLLRRGLCSSYHHSECSMATRQNRFLQLYEIFFTTISVYFFSIFLVLVFQFYQ